MIAFHLTAIDSPDCNEQVVRLDLEVLARISINSEGKIEKKHFEMVLQHLLRLFAGDVAFLERRGSLIIRQLSLLLNGEAVYRAFAALLKDHEDLEFASLMVQTLNLILLTSTELFELRASLKHCLATPQGRDLFLSLYGCWTHNPVATLALCLLSQAHALAASLALSISEIEITVGLLMQLDKLVQLLESPIFVHLRLMLLQPHKHVELVKALYGILMLLPQSTSFSALSTRLRAVSPLTAFPADATSATSYVPGVISSELLPASLLLKVAGGAAAGSTAVSASDKAGDKAGAAATSTATSSADITSAVREFAGDAESGAKRLDVPALVMLFSATQQRHQIRRKKLARAASLMGGSSAAGVGPGGVPPVSAGAAAAAGGAGAGAAAAGTRRVSSAVPAGGSGPSSSAAAAAAAGPGQ